MATPVFLPGRRYLLKRWNGTSYIFFGVVENKALKQQANYADTTAPDENNPTNVPTRKSIKTSTQWDVTFSGMMDSAKRATFQSDMDAEDPVKWAFEHKPENGVGAGYYSGNVFFESFEQSGETKGMTAFSVSARGDDALTWTDGAAP